MKQIKLISILSILTLAGIVVSSSRQFASQAENDEILTELVKYKTWTMVSKAPIKVDVDLASLAGG